MHFSPMPPIEVLKTWLDYDPNTGHLTWIREPRPDNPLLGRRAGTLIKKTGYVRIRIRPYGTFAAHRLAWLFVHGHLLTHVEVDHRDGNPSNNSISNLRLATSSEQKRNRCIQSNNRSGLKGAYYHAMHKGKKWRSQIKLGKGHLLFLGYFHTAEEAHAAYCGAARKHFGDFARVA